VRLVDGDSGSDAEQCDDPSRPCRRRAPREPDRDQRKADREREIRDPDRDRGAEHRARGAIAADEGDAGEAEDGCNQRGNGAGQDMRGRADPPLRQELTGGERQQLAFARRHGCPEHPEPQRQRRHDRGRPGNGRVQEPSRGNLGERQQHDAGERQARDAVLELCGERG
jgi:hypothetical protein